MKLTWLADVARAEGLTVKEVSGWKTRGYDYGRYRPMLSASYGVVIAHHTAENRNSGDAGGLNVVVYGRQGLAGPIANYYLSRSGIVYVVAAGVSNNAGSGNARLIGHSGWDGNSTTIGIEAANDGLGEPWGAEQMDAYARLCAALCKKMGWPAKRVLGHKEWSTTGKPDPSFDMNTFRERVAAAMRGEDDVDPNDFWHKARVKWAKNTALEEEISPAEFLQRLALAQAGHESADASRDAALRDALVAELQEAAGDLDVAVIEGAVERALGRVRLVVDNPA